MKMFFVSLTVKHLFNPEILINGFFVLFPGLTSTHGQHNVYDDCGRFTWNSVPFFVLTVDAFVSR